MGHYNELYAYKKSFALAMKIYHISKSFPAEEKYSLTDQIRRSSRSVCANLAEAYRRRHYKNYFTAKLFDAQSENTETEVWLEFSKECNILNKDLYVELTDLCSEAGRLIAYMIANPDKFMLPGKSENPRHEQGS